MPCGGCGDKCNCTANQCSHSCKCESSCTCGCKTKQTSSDTCKTKK